MAARTSAAAAAASRSYWREADARHVVEAWRRSGQSLSRFATARGLKAARLSRWASRLGRRAVRTRGRGSAGPARLKLRFHPVELVGNATALEVGAIEVVLLDGRRVRVAAGFAGDDLARVLRVLEDRRQC